MICSSGTRNLGNELCPYGKTKTRHLKENAKCTVEYFARPKLSEIHIFYSYSMQMYKFKSSPVYGPVATKLDHVRACIFLLADAIAVA